MKTPSLWIAAALLAAACTSPTEEGKLGLTPAHAPVAQQDAAAQQAAEEQAMIAAKAEAAREIAKAHQAQIELARQQAALQEAERKAAEQAEAERRVAEELAAEQAAAAKAADEDEKVAAERAAAGKATAAAAAQEGTMAAGGDLDVVAEIETTAGTMVLGFLPAVAPGHVKNFVDLSRKGFYDGTRFHRTIPGFMIQGGDPFTKDLSKQASWGMGDPGYKIKAEFSTTPHVRGTLSMARGRDPDSAGSQFFICHARAANLDRGYTVFGELLRGYDVLDKIATAPAGMAANGEKSRPLEPVQVVKVTIRARTADDVKEGS